MSCSFSFGWRLFVIRFNWMQLEMERVGGCHSSVEMCLCGETPFPSPFLSLMVYLRFEIVLPCFACFCNVFQSVSLTLSLAISRIQTKYILSSAGGAVFMNFLSSSLLFSLSEAMNTSACAPVGCSQI